MLTRGSEGIVDWELSREIAQLQLDSFIEDGEYSESAELWQLPIGIYNKDGEIRYYEFRIIDEGEVIAAIAINAQESLGGPVAYVFSMKGYYDSLMDLYKNGTLSENEIPRIIDNVYPNYVVASSEIKRSGDITFDRLLSPENGEEVEGVDVLVSTEDFIKENPELFSEEEKAEKLEEISNYREDNCDFWKTAKEYKGRMGSFVFRGKTKNTRKELDANLLREAIKISFRRTKENPRGRTIPRSYGACGATASGFILDYLDAMEKNVSEWSKINDLETRKSELRKALSIADKSNITWPWNLSGAVSKFSDYKVTSSSFWPKKSINNNIPGISLRSLKLTSWEDLTGGFHYRNVIAYKEEGWGIFKWDYIKIFDGNNCDDGWEAYNPLWHVSSYNVVKK
ncbi:MAG: hypothetical protein K6E78_06070 [Treponema sp.]|nr:hypothetical protein [Treponema sp.]